MEPARHLEILRTETELVGSVEPSWLGAAVPALEDWTVERVVRHLGKLHQWVLAVTALEPGQTMSDLPPLAGLPKGPDCLPAYREAAAAMLATFDVLDPERACINFAGIDTVGWWTRRQAQEVSVHRMDVHDAIHAAGGPAPTRLAADGAADGIDEWARFFLSVRWGQRFGALPDDLGGHTIHIHGTDDPAPTDGAEWLLTFGDEGVDVQATHAKGDVAMRGAAADLLLVLWRRRPLSAIELIGDASVAEALLDIARF